MAAKIKDGLFIGDADTSQSEVFINDNKISNLINLSGREVQNIWSSHGLVYLTYYWEDRADYKLFHGHDDTMLTDIVEFIDVSINHGISVLLFSRRGTGRCVVAACLYLMMKYRWGFEKTYDYVYSKKPDIDLNKGFVQQMFALDMKLLAARQNAQAVARGLEGGFSIAADMTIADIAAMLPRSEAKRWNSWDVEYLLEQERARDVGDGHSADWRDSKLDSKGDRRRHSGRPGLRGGQLAALHQEKEDAEEELVLIYSFINGKNTINALPGPYRTAYDMPKNFRLRFDARLCQEADVHMFPSSPPAPRYTCAPRGILKGGLRSGKNYVPTAAQPKQHSDQRQGQPRVARSDSKGGGQSASNPLLDSIAPMYLINSARNGNNNAGGLPSGGHHATRDGDDRHSAARTSSEFRGGDAHLVESSSQAAVASSATASSKQQQPPPRDLYGFVGMAPSSASAEGKRDTRDTNSVHSNGSSGVAVGALSAEERLRNLMADMQRQNYGSTAGGATAVAEERPRHTNGSNDRVHSSAASAAAAPSLYDLANMHFAPPPQSRARVAGTAGPQGRPQDFGDSSRQFPSLPDDPLAAFEMQLHQRSAAPATSGAVRARHDILGSSQQQQQSGIGQSSGGGSRGAPNYSASARQPVRAAWSSGDSVGSQQQQQHPRQAAGSRPASPSVRQQQTQGGSSSSMSVTSVGSGASSQLPPPGGPQAVGSGTSTASRVYRHGSPAPNRGKVASGNVSGGSYGHSGGGVYRNSLGSTAPTPPARSATYSGIAGGGRDSRPASPMTARGRERDQTPVAVPQRRLSSGSFGSEASSMAPSQQSQADRRRSGSPMGVRSSLGGSGPQIPSAGGKRYSTPTPQSHQHHDYDAQQQQSRGAVRSSTPTKTWRF